MKKGLIYVVCKDYNKQTKIQEVLDKMDRFYFQRRILQKL